MEKFIVSARKYRPQHFSTVVGQSHITTTLKNAIRNQQLAHAFLFCGPRGVGKTTCARILAKSINCENLQSDGEACDKCHSCVSFNEGSSMNIHELDAASNNSVDDIRSLVEQVRFAPQAGKYKVYIIDEVHMLSSSAFNAFLKTLEEPPPYAIFILATTEKHKILPTILSRCQVFDFKRITQHDIVEHLGEICGKEDIAAEGPAIEMIAQKSEGCMRDALSIMDKLVSFSNGKLTYADTLEHLNILDADYYFRLLEMLQQQSLSDALLLFDEINRKGFEGDLLLNGFSEFLRDLLVSRDEKAAVLLEVVGNFKERYRETARRTDAGFLISALNILSEAEIQYRGARNKRLQVELTLIRLSYLTQALHLAAGTETTKGIAGARPVAFRIVPPMEVRGKPQLAAVVGPAGSGAKLEIEQPARKTAHKQAIDKVPEKNNVIPETTTDIPDIMNDIPEPKQDIRETKNKSQAGTGPTGSDVKQPSLSALSKIRQEVLNRKQQAETDPARPLEETILRSNWDSITDTLKKDKNPAYQSFALAELKITGPLNFEVLTNNNLEQRFVEQEKRSVSDMLLSVFNNRSIAFSVIVREDAAPEEVTERPLTKREQFHVIAEQYPLLKELKDRLRLELDY